MNKMDTFSKKDSSLALQGVVTKLQGSDEYYVKVERDFLKVDVENSLVKDLGQGLLVEGVLGGGPVFIVNRTITRKEFKIKGRLIHDEGEYFYIELDSDYYIDRKLSSVTDLKHGMIVEGYMGDIPENGDPFDARFVVERVVEDN